MATAAAHPLAPSPLAMLQRRPWIIPLVIVALMALQIKGWWIPGPDATAYLSISRNMAGGVLACLGSPHLRYAPGYPALIAPSWWLSESPFWWISLLHLFLAAALAAGVYQWARRLQPDVAVLVTALVLANTTLWEAFRRTHTELAFTTELVWAALCLECAASSRRWPATVAWATGGVALATLAVLTRHVGVMLIPGFTVMLAMRAWRRELPWVRASLLAVAVSLPVLAAVSALMVWDRARAEQAGPDAKTYAHDLRDQSFTPPEQIAEGARLRIAECGRLLIPGMVKCYARAGQWLNINSLIYLALAPVLLLGWIRLTRRVPDALLLTLPLYTALYVVWPFDQATRFMLPMLPVLCAAAAEAISGYDFRHKLLATLTAAHLAVSLVYWVHATWASPYPADWQSLAVLSGPITSSNEPAAIWDLDEQRADMLRLQVDRALPQSDEDQIAAEVHWLVGSMEGPPPDGFILHRSSGRFVLWERTSNEGSPAAALSQAEQSIRQ